MKVAGVQMDLAWEDCERNLAAARERVRRAAGLGAELVALPEMFNTGFTMRAEAAAGHAERTRDFLAKLAVEAGCAVLAGHAEPGPRRPHNACSLFDASGAEILRAHKLHPFSLAGEHEHYEGGEAVETATLGGVRVTPMICYDLRFPEPFRAAAARTDLFVVIANWPARRRAAWSALLVARAIENQCFVLGVNRVGEGGELPHAGDSGLVDPFGELRCSAAWQEACVLGEVDPGEVAEARARFSFLADRRPGLYRRLEDDPRP